MSATRETLAAALSTVPKINGHVTRPKAFKVGDAWPLIGGFIPGRARTVATQWRVIVFLGQDERKAEDLFSDLFWPIADAVRSQAVVDSASAFIYPVEGGQAFAAEFILRSD